MISNLLLADQLGRRPFAAVVKEFISTVDTDSDGKISLPEYIADVMDADWEAVPSNRESCPSCNHSWLDKYGISTARMDAPNVSPRWSGGGRQIRQPGEASTNRQFAGSAMESQSGEYPKGGAHNWKFGKCSDPSAAKARAARPPRNSASVTRAASISTSFQSVPNAATMNSD